MTEPPGVPASGIEGRRAIFASGTWIAASTLLPYLATAALSVVAGRLLGAELLGQQSLIAFVGALIAAVVINSLTDASIRWLAATRTADPEAVPSLARWTTRGHLLAGVISGAVLAGIGVARGEYVTAWLIVAGTSVIDAYSWGWSSRIIARDGWAPVARRRLLTQSVGVGLGIVAVIAGLGIEGIFAANAVATVLLLALLRPLVEPARGPAGRPWHRPVVAMWGLFAFLAVLSQIVSARIEIVFLGIYADGDEIAQYSVAVMLVTAAIVLPSALAGASMPAVAAAAGEGDTERASRSLSRALRVASVISLPLTALVVASGPSFIVGLYGDDFTRAGELSRYLALAALVVPCGQLASNYWSGLGRLRLLVVAGVCGAIVDLGAAFAFVPDLGAAGAVIASLAGQGTAEGLILILTWRALGRPSLGGRGWATGLVLSTAAAGAGVWAAAPGGLLGAVTAGLATTVVFVVLALVAGRLRLPLLGAEDGEWLRDSLPIRLRSLVRPLIAS